MLQYFARILQSFASLLHLKIAYCRKLPDSCNDVRNIKNKGNKMIHQTFRACIMALLKV
jgi:hypothetical protein